MSVIYKVITRPTDPRVPNSPKRYYPHLITLGQSVNLKYIAQKMQDRSSLSIGDIKSTMQNFVEKLKEQLLEGKTVNIAGLGVFILAAKSKGEEKADDVTAKSVESVRICFQANRELKISKAATRAGERLDLVSLDDYFPCDLYERPDACKYCARTIKNKTMRRCVVPQGMTAVRVRFRRARRRRAAGCSPGDGRPARWLRGRGACA